MEVQIVLCMEVIVNKYLEELLDIGECLETKLEVEGGGKCIFLGN